MTESNPEPSTGNIGFRVAQVAIGLGIVAALVWFFMRPNAAQLAREARSAFRKADYELANELATKAFELQPNNDLVTIGAESCQKLDDIPQAIDWYGQLVEDDSEDYVTGITTLASLCFQEGRLTESQAAFEKVLQQQPDNPALNRAFAQLLNAQGRRWESTRYYTKTIRAASLGNEVLMQDVLLIANHEALFEDAAVCEKAIAATPGDPIGKLGLVRVQLRENKYDEALAALTEITSTHPGLLEAHALTCQGLVEADRLDKVPEWNAKLPEDADEFPAIWYQRGTWAEKAGQPEAAARCYWESLRLEPNSISANQRLGLTLVALDRKVDAQPFVDRQGKLSDYNKATHPIYLEGPNLVSIERARQLTNELGRPWEELTWCGVLMQFGPQLRATPEVLQEASGRYRQLKSDLARTMPPQTYEDANPAMQLDLSGYPRPDWSRPISKSSESNDVTDSGTIRFEDVAADVGLDFTYFNSADDTTKGFRMFETGGGGVAAFDFDLDGWPDIYFTQGAVWPVDPKTETHTHTLFRSVAGDEFVDVTEVANATDLNFGQGVAIADFDSDGFPDVYLGHIGHNRLLHNNGDGTFDAVPAPLANPPKRWTTSVLAADLNGDGHPDLFDVNYLGGETIYTDLCGAEVQRSCGPSAFAGDLDDLFFNTGDGSFEDVTAAAGLGDANGKGLGVVAADFDGTGLLNVFVANDGIENYYWIPEKTNSGIKFVDSAFERGVAFDKDSRGQACMGVAVDDHDGNGSLDIFITNFTDDSNTLYSMTVETLFEDIAREAGLRVPSFDLLGFGTQFIDADLDGKPDLVVTNGHVDDFSAGENYRMRPQIFRNLGGRFAEVMPRADDRYLNAKQLGRGLARIDFNRDGRQDFVVSHLDTPAALVQNDTPTDSHFITLRLVGTRSCRDAIGTTVVVESGNLKRSTQLIGGSGYQAENERILNIGVGPNSKIDRLTVRWLSGAEQVFENLAADTEYILIENSPSPLTSPR